MIKNQFFRNFSNISSKLTRKYEIFKKIKPVYFLSGFMLLILIYASIFINTNLKEKRKQQIGAFLSNNQTVLLRNYIFNKIKSPYLEYDYIVKNSDTIESILKKFSVKQSEVALIVKKIKKKDLSNISPGQKIKFILKKSKNGKDLEIFKINYPISKTTFVRIDKRKDGIEITRNITQLFKRRVVVQGNISNNLYSSASNAGMEPGIIIEFAKYLVLRLIFREI